MRQITPEELKTILENHLHWLREDCDGWENMRADLRGADLRGAYLREADLRGAYLRGSYLRGADLSGADLIGAYLREAYLRGSYLRGSYLRRADLREADLSGADLSGADLRGADLRGADLRGAYLREAYLSGADLSGADLRGAYLREAYLSGADLSGADLRGADLRGAKNVPFIPYSCPDYGSFIGYKKASGYIVELEILSDSRRLSATGRKCRCDKAKVLSIQNINGTKAEINSVASSYDSRFIYTVGEIVKVDDFDENRFNECSTGIHFFINRQEAVDY